jgi:anti-sigma factor RsiW
MLVSVALHRNSKGGKGSVHDESPPLNCKEFAHCITPAVDGRLSARDHSSFQEHARLCPSCRRNFEEERSLAALIRARLRPVRVPDGVLASILEGTRACDASRVPSLVFADILHRPRSMSVVAVILSLAAIAYVLTRQFPPAAGVEAAGFVSSSDIVRQSASNYEAVLKGEIVPQVVSDRPEHVRAYFRGKIGFPVFIPAMKECTLVGGIVNDYQGMHLAHVVYRHGLQFIYLYQACRESVMKGDTLHLSREAKNDLNSTGWHCCTAPDGASIVLWVSGRTICAAVAPMNSGHLMAHIAEADVPAAW